eukprot:UN23911
MYLILEKTANSEVSPHY